MNTVAPELVTAATALIIDKMSLRRAAIAGLLESWTASLGLKLKSSHVADLDHASDAKIIFISIGGERVSDPHYRQLIESVHGQVPDVPLVVISDREEPDEMICAFQIGIRGFISTGSEPEIVRRALAFIMAGGSFFPPTALLRYAPQSTTNAEGSRHRPDNGEESGRLDSCLTARQREVLEFLRLGTSNKMIARKLCMSESTVKVHVRQIMRRLGASNRTHAALMYTSPGSPSGTSEA